jgi:Uma2 family endonuclease
MDAIALAPAIHLSDEQFEQLCRQNPDTNFELSAKGELIVVPPVGLEGGSREFTLIGQFYTWAERDGTGIACSSQTLFQLPNGAKRMPDVAWVRKARVESLTPEQKRGFPPIAPDFIIELRSPSDAISALEEKMEEYLDAGVKLAWLVDPTERTVTIYRSTGQERLENPIEVSGDPDLPGFVLRTESLFR